MSWISFICGMGAGIALVFAVTLITINRDTDTKGD